MEYIENNVIENNSAVLATVYGINQERRRYKNDQMDIIIHDNNTPMQSVTFHGCKINNFQMKNCDVFLNFALNIDFGYK